MQPPQDGEVWQLMIKKEWQSTVRGIGGQERGLEAQRLETVVRKLGCGMWTIAFGNAGNLDNIHQGLLGRASQKGASQEQPRKLWQRHS